VPFKPVGRAARWRILYEELLKHANPGDLITYEQMAELLELHPERDRPKIHQAISRAGDEFLEEDKHALEPVPGRGYTVVTANKHLDIGRRHQKKASRALTRSHTVVTNVDLNGVEPELRNAFTTVARAIAQQQRMMKDWDIRQKNLEEKLQGLSTHQEHTAEELERLKARLAHLEEHADVPPKEYDSAS
jgi:hypothetical protein